MAIFKCKMCGGDLELEIGSTVCTCEYCGSKQTVPAADNEKKMTLFGRANRLRAGCEFDKAAGVYESIVADFPEEAEAYWGLVLCRYGIEYVDDPATGKKIPTCHRSSFDSVMEDSDFEQAMENADEMALRVYREEAKAIEELRRGIVEVSGKEAPYDIFICYKETDEKGERTLDSVLAQDVYDALTEKGYRVFFSRISLEDKLGTEYEPYIFAALNSAKVMLAFGTDYTYYNAVWVKNEWSRYLKLMAQDKTRHLIPCYKNLDAYDMPKEFAKLQAQDMGKVGAMQDLLRGVDKLLGRRAAAPESAGTAVANTASLLKRAFMFLEDGKWEDANTYCEKVLDIDPECAEAYLGKLMAELQVYKQDQLADCEESFEENENCQKASKFGDEKLKAELRGYIAGINERNENARLTGIYNGAVNAMNEADSEEACEAAAQAFQTILGFKDSKALTEQCLEKAEQLKQERLAKEESGKIAAKKRKKAFAIGMPIVAACIAFVVVLTTVILPKQKYNEAMDLIESGDYDTAYALLEEIGNTDAIASSKYDRAMKLIDSGDYETACVILNGLEYKDSETKLSEIKSDYYQALFSNAEVGSTVFFGAYEQDNDTSNGKEDIEWRVLAKENDRLLVISEKALDCQPYNTHCTNVTWETCSLREWMNGTFLNEAFSTDEQAIIQNTNVSADKNPNYSTNPGNATTDKVFLLSIMEAERHLSSDEDRKCVLTTHAIAQGASADSISGKTTCLWWLRTPCHDPEYAATVYYDGSIRYGGYYVYNDSFGVRPAMWIDLSKLN